MMHINEMRVMNWGTQALTQERAAKVKRLKDRHTEDLTGIVGAVYRAETGKQMERRHQKRQTYLLFGMMNWIFGWYFAGDHGSVDELILDIYHTFLQGVTGPRNKPIAWRSSPAR